APSSLNDVIQERLAPAATGRACAISTATAANRCVQRRIKTRQLNLRVSTRLHCGRRGHRRSALKAREDPAVSRTSLRSSAEPNRLHRRLTFTTATPDVAPFARGEAKP